MNPKITTFSERVALACDADRRAVDPHRHQASSQHAAHTSALAVGALYRDEQDAAIVAAGGVPTGLPEDADLWDAACELSPDPLPSSLHGIRKGTGHVVLDSRTMTMRDWQKVGRFGAVYGGQR